MKPRPLFLFKCFRKWFWGRCGFADGKLLSKCGRVAHEVGFTESCVLTSLPLVVRLIRAVTSGTRLWFQQVLAFVQAPVPGRTASSSGSGSGLGAV